MAMALTCWQVARGVEWEHLSPLAWRRDEMGSLAAVQAGGIPLHLTSPVLLSILQFSRSVCGLWVCQDRGSGDRQSLPDGRAAAHFHLDRGISISA